MNDKKERTDRIRVAAALVVMITALIVEKLAGVRWFVILPVYLTAYAAAGYDVVIKAVKRILKGNALDENFLMTIATAGAFIVGDYEEGVAVMIFYQVGEMFQRAAVRKSRQSVKELMDICPEYANLCEGDVIREVDPEEVCIGDIIVIKPGERIPLDARVISGTSQVDTKALTGEPVPVRVSEGDNIVSGCINLNTVLKAEVIREYEDSTVSKILELVENAGSRKAKQERFITRFAKYYTPVVVICALIMALIVPIFTGGDFKGWIYSALTFLVVSCPCALVISVPLGFFGGIGNASKKGILIKGGSTIEMLADVKVVVFDKTGTLTKGNFKVTSIEPYEGEGRTYTKEALLELAVAAESISNHPIAKAIAVAGEELGKQPVCESAEELAGRGIRAVAGGIEILAGNELLMRENKIAADVKPEAGTIVYIAADKQYAGRIIIQDEIKDDAKKALEALRAGGTERLVMLTGDNEAAAMSVAEKVGIDEIHAGLLPDDKVEIFEEIIAGTDSGKRVMFVGDGINDAPVLARADVGAAMGGMGSDAAIEAADLVIMNDEPSKLYEAVKISKKTLAIVKQNIVFAIAVKLLVLLLAAVKMSNMWAAVFADVGVAVVAILNASRALRIK